MAEERLKPRIAYILTPITFGGAEKVNLNFLKHVDRERFQILPILFLRPWEDETLFESELREQGYEYLSIPVARAMKPEMFRVVRCLIKLISLLKEHSFDLVHTHGYLADLLGCAAAKLLDLPIISTCHGFIHHGWKLSLYVQLDCLALRSFTRVIAVAGNIREELERKGVKSHNIVLIENVTQVPLASAAGMEIGESLRRSAGIGDDDLLIGYVGRLSREKGVNFLIEAFGGVAKAFPRAKLVVIGDGEERDDLLSLADRHGLREQLVFTGFQRNVEEWFRCMDLLVLPSLTEGTPMVLLEAMSLGIPCIASAVGGVPKLIESGSDGLLVKPGRPEELGEAISVLLSDRALRLRLGASARSKAVRLGDPGGWTRRIEDQYLQVLGRNGYVNPTEGASVRECPER